MTNRANDALLGKLHGIVANALTAKVLSGEATAAEMANAIRFLKDNGIEGIADPDSALGRLVDALPDFPTHPEGELPN